MRPPLKFAVVREDPALEVEVLRRYQRRRPLIVASGGCTALTLTGEDLDAVTAFDLNPTQLAHVEAKASARARGDLAALGVESTDGLHERGAFEGLFRVLRRFVEEFVGPPTPERWRSPYWPAAFHTTFNDEFLHAMFGPAATQHAAKGSYPGYFQRVFERGLLRADAAKNPFLHHVFSGAYRRDAMPPFITAKESVKLTLVEGSLLDVPNLERFDFFSLSNVFDWSDDVLVSAWANALAAAEPGSVVLLRQLNNQRDLRAFFAPHFVADVELGEELLARDQSLFYERIEVLVRQ